MRTTQLLCRAALSIVVLAVLTGCDSAGVTAPAVAPTPTPAPTPSMLYVASSNTGSGLDGAILGFSLKTSGNVAPVVNISGSNTQLKHPTGLAIDAKGQFYVSNLMGTAIYIYAAGANGNVAPIASISGSNTTLTSIQDISLDSSGNLWVSDYLVPAIDEFAAGQTGNIAPIRRISGTATQFAFPYSVSVDAAGDVYVGDLKDVWVFPPGANGNVAPSRSITSSGLTDFAVAKSCASGSLAVAEAPDGTALEFPANANGSTTPSAVVTGSSTGLTNAQGIACDRLGNIFVADSPSWNDGSLYEFAAGATGNVAPVWSVSGSNTLLADPFAVVLH
jgi:hypothetical protein